MKITITEYKGALILQDEKQVYCRITLADYNTDEEARAIAEKIIKALETH